MKKGPGLTEDTAGLKDPLSLPLDNDPVEEEAAPTEASFGLEEKTRPAEPSLETGPALIEKKGTKAKRRGRPPKKKAATDDNIQRRTVPWPKDLYQRVMALKDHPYSRFHSFDQLVIAAVTLVTEAEEARAERAAELARQEANDTLAASLAQVAERKLRPNKPDESS